MGILFLDKVLCQYGLNNYQDVLPTQMEHISFQALKQYFGGEDLNSILPKSPNHGLSKLLYFA